MSLIIFCLYIFHDLRVNALVACYCKMNLSDSMCSTRFSYCKNVWELETNAVLHYRLLFFCVLFLSCEQSVLCSFRFVVIIIYYAPFIVFLLLAGNISFSWTGGRCWRRGLRGSGRGAWDCVFSLWADRPRRCQGHVYVCVLCDCFDDDESKCFFSRLKIKTGDSISISMSLLKRSDKLESAIPLRLLVACYLAVISRNNCGPMGAFSSRAFCNLFP